ncbi:MAG: cysteine synthase A [Candidatus Aenigmatarchaeota archaeon]
MNILEAIGNTPLVRIGSVWAKLETANPTGSIKDRMAWHMVRRAEARGELKPNSDIIELTSGNTGVSFAMISAVRGYKFTAVMPESMSAVKQRMMTAFGAKLVLTPAKDDMAGALKRYEALAEQNPSAWLPKQFENPDNIKCHREELGKEILEQMNGDVDAFVAGIGTGGTLIGVAQALERINPNVRIIGVEPAECAVLSGGKPGLHKIEGIGEGFVPKLVQEHRYAIDEVVAIKSGDAIAMAKELARKHGMLVGISSGANILAAQAAAKKYKRVVTVLPDSGDRYLELLAT